MFNCFPDADARAKAWVGLGLATPLLTPLMFTVQGEQNIDDIHVFKVQLVHASQIDQYRIIQQVCMSFTHIKSSVM